MDRVTERPAYLAGRWYPGDERGCRAAIEGHAADTTPEPGRARGLIGPHAGWAFSGDAAGRSYRWLAHGHPDADVVIVFGGHRGPLGPHTLFRAEGWQTPLGTLRTASGLADAVAAAWPLEDEPVRPARPDNAVELHLPFVRHFFPRAELLVLGVGASEVAADIGRRVGEVVEASGRDAVFVGSTDLTHYGPNYGWAPKGTGPASVAWVRDDNDAGFLQAVLAKRPRAAVRHALANHSACCPGAVAAAMEASEAYAGSYHPRLIDHYLSHDVRPDESFVGYAGLLL